MLWIIAEPIISVWYKLQIHYFRFDILNLSEHLVTGLELTTRKSSTVCGTLFDQ